MKPVLLHAHTPSAKELFTRRMFLLGITEASKVELLWNEECQRRKEVMEKQKTERKIQFKDKRK
jgi:hypothetical protein